MLSRIFIVFSAIVISTTARQEDDGYYWREYKGDIPPDAVPADKDNSSYIGQAFLAVNTQLQEAAIVPVQIFPGIPSVNVPLFGIHKNTTTDIKILCGLDPKRFQWYQTDSKHIRSQLIATGKHLIPGGTELWLETHIGKITYSNHVRIGKIDTYNGFGSAKFYFADFDNEITTGVYQVLIYET